MNSVAEAKIMTTLIQRSPRRSQQPRLTFEPGGALSPGRPRPEVTPLVGPWLMRLAGLGLVVLIALIVQTNLARWQSEARATKTGTTPLFAPAEPAQAIKAPDFGETGLPVSQLNPARIDPSAMAYEQMFQEIAPRYGLDWRLLAQLAYQESRLNRLALGRDNDLGLMQILPSTWNEWAPRVGVTDPFDPYSNIEVGAAYLAYLRDYAQARGYYEPQWMLVGYNGGPDRLRQLFAGNGTWAQVPEKQRRYALAILQASSSGSIARLDQPN